MASGIFVLLDDLATITDGVATMGKVATEKTAAVLGDDLAVNAEKASGFEASREIPVLWAITKGSLLNKLIILPIAFLLSAFLPWAITVILIFGGFYLAFEGVEKIYDYIKPKKHSKEKKQEKVLSEEELLKHEKFKIKSAIRTDFILSIEIVIIALGTVVEAPIFKQIIVVTSVAILATIGVYGIVGLIVKMDDIGYKMIDFNKREKSLSDFIGKILVKTLPLIIKSLGVIGTIALLLVSGGIFAHNIHFLHDVFLSLPLMVRELLAGLLAGTIAFVLVKIFKVILTKIKKNKAVVGKTP